MKLTYSSLLFSLLGACAALPPSAESANEAPRIGPTPTAPWSPLAPGHSGSEPGSDDSGGTGTGGGTDGVENPLTGLVLWVDPTSNPAQQADAWRASSPDDAAAMDTIATQPVAKWLGGWNSDVEGDVRGAMDDAEADGAIRVFVVYNLPNRDCGGYSSGGASDASGYEAWIDAIARGMAGRTSVVVLEPDGLSMMDCLSSAEADTRYALLGYAVSTLRGSGALVYLDGGHSAWHASGVMAERLLFAEVGLADGFALNTSNYETSDALVAYGADISGIVGGAHFIGDTSRNGLGPTSDHAWCNPDGRALGLPPTFATGHPLVDALLWVKAPGESDGSCNGGPAAGTWWPEYALGLAQRATW